MEIPVEVVSYRDRISAVIRRAENQPDLELVADQTKFICVLTSGFLEVSVRSMLAGWCGIRCHPNISNAMESSLRGFQNPKLGKILELIQTFSSDWRAHFEDSLSDQQKDAIDSIVANRHQIAHGRNVGLSLVPMKRYFKDAVDAMELLAAVLD